MKKLLEIYKPYMVRPILYKAVTRFVIGFMLSLLWNRFLNMNNYRTMTEYAFLFFAALFFAMAWFNYLKLDGIRIIPLNRNENQKKKPKHKLKMMTDFTEEETISPDALDKDEALIVSISANILAGVCFVLPYVLSVFF